MDTAVFLISAAIVLAGAGGVLVARNPVHAALFLVQTLFGVAVLFVLQDATFLAAVQVIVYAGAGQHDGGTYQEYGGIHQAGPPSTSPSSASASPSPACPTSGARTP